MFLVILKPSFTIMKKILYILLISFGLFSFTSDSETTDTTGLNFAFKSGEVLSYRLHYGFLNAGSATLKVDNTKHTIKEKSCFRVDVVGKSVGAFRAALKIDDFWRTYIDEQTLAPKKFFREIKEGNYYLKEDVFYYPTKVKVLHTYKDKTTEVKEYSTADGIHDIISAFYRIRNIDWNNKSKGDKITINAFLEDTKYDMEIEYKGKEKIRTKFGKVNAIKLAPIMPDNDLFKGEDAILFYISDDKNHIPLKVRAEMFVGAVELDIKAYSGLKHDLNKVK